MTSFHSFPGFVIDTRITHTHTHTHTHRHTHRRTDRQTRYHSLPDSASLDSPGQPHPDNTHSQSHTPVKSVTLPFLIVRVSGQYEAWAGRYLLGYGVWRNPPGGNDFQTPLRRNDLFQPVLGLGRSFFPHRLRKKVLLIGLTHVFCPPSALPL